MKSQIDEILTEKERKVLDLYKNPKASDLNKQIRLAVQYAIGSGIFLWLTIWYNEPIYAIAVYVIFIVFMFIRILRARAIIGIMPKILNIYDSEIARFRSQTNTKIDNPPPSL